MTRSDGAWMTQTKNKLLSNLLSMSSNMTKMTSRENHVANDNRLSPTTDSTVEFYCTLSTRNYLLFNC